jgi:hypothetical protein
VSDDATGTLIASGLADVSSLWDFINPDGPGADIPFVFFAIPLRSSTLASGTLTATGNGGGFAAGDALNMQLNMLGESVIRRG